MTYSIQEPVFDFHAGASPLLISMPHPGTALPGEIGGSLVAEARTLPDTDWHIPKLYDFAAGMGAGILAARYSRFAIDLNRPPDDAPLYSGATTGLFPTTLFDGTPIFAKGKEPAANVRKTCRDAIWLPYHQRLADELARIKDLHGYAVLLDAHSIRSRVPRLFEGELPDFNLGTNDGKSCDLRLQDAASAACRHNAYRSVLNGRFKGGYITRHYGQPAHAIHAIQLELAQRTYMTEAPPFQYDDERANGVRPILRRLVETLINWRP